MKKIKPLKKEDINVNDLIDIGKETVQDLIDGKGCYEDEFFSSIGKEFMNAIYGNEFEKWFEENWDEFGFV